MRQRVVVVISPQRGVAAGGYDFKHALCQPQDGDVKRAAAQVKNGICTLAAIVKPICDGSGGGLIDQAQHVEARQLRRIFGRLALGIVEISRHRDDCAIQVIAQGIFCAIPQGSQYLGTHLNGGFFALHSLQAQHAGVIHKPIRQLVRSSHILETAAHEALDRSQGIFGIKRQRGFRLEANLPTITRQIPDHRWENHPALLVGQAFGNAMAHRSDQGVRGTQVDTHRQTPLMRIGGLTGFRYL